MIRTTSAVTGLAALLLAACASGPAPIGEADSVAGEYLQGRFAATQKKADVAAVRFAAAAERTGAKPVTDKAFDAALAGGDVEGALRFAEALLAAPAAAPEDHIGMGRVSETDMPRLALAAAALERGQPEAALAQLEAPFSSSIGRSVAHMIRAWALYGAQGPEPAIKALQETPQDVIGAFVPLHLGILYELSGQPGPAEAGYAAAVRAPGGEMAVIAGAGLLERAGKTGDALARYRRMSEDRGYIRRVGRLGLARLGEPLPGESDAFLKAARRTPTRLADDAASGAALALTNFAWGQYEQVLSQREAAARAGFGDLDLPLDAPLAFARLALFLDADQDAAAYILGGIQSIYGLDEAVAETHARARPSSWFYNYAAIDRADALVAMDRPKEAIRVLTDYVEQDALSPDVLITLTQLYAEDERWDRALDAASRAIEIAGDLSSEETKAGNLWRYHFARGVTASDADRWDEAEADLRRALELSPEEPILLNFLGYTYVERGENLEEAFEMIERALYQEPESGAITDSLGWAHYQMGRYEQAVALLEEAVQLEPGDDVITDHLGDAYWQLGRRAEARYEWRRVLEADPLDPEVEAAARAKLAGEPPAPGALVSQQP